MLSSRYIRPVATTLVVLLVAGVAGAYFWVHVINPCDVDAVKEASDFLIIQVKQYDRVYASAASGTPKALTYPVTVMQNILVDTQGVDVPACMSRAKKEAIAYMGTVLRAFDAYTAGEADLRVRDLVNQSNRNYYDFHAELQAVKECAPFCFR